MKTLPWIRLFLIFNVCLLTTFPCASIDLTNADSRLDLVKKDLSKIYVDTFSSASNVQFPDKHENALNLLQQAIEHELFLQGLLQVDKNIHTLSLHGVILSYEDEVFDVQGELYNGDEFLVYSRVRRHLNINDDWERGITLIAKQMLAELMQKMQLPEPKPHPVPLPDPVPDPTEDIFVDDSDHGHGKKRPEKPSGSGDKPKPIPHSLPEVIFESLPRTMHVSEEITRRKHAIEHEQGIRESTESSTPLPDNSGNGGDGEAGVPASTPSIDHTPPLNSKHESGSSPAKPTRGQFIPKSNNEEHQRRASDTSKQTAESVPSKQTKSQNNDSSTSGNRSHTGAMPRSHQSKRE